VNHNQQRQLDALRRVQNFLDSHAGDVEAVKECDGRKQLDDAVARIDASIREQGMAARQIDGLQSRQKTLVSELRYRHMQPIATFARARLQGAPDFAALTRSTLRLGPRPLVHAARAMADAAAPHGEALAKGGFPGVIASLFATADALAKAMEDRAKTRTARQHATQELREQVQLGRTAVSMLHAVVNSQCGHDKVFMTTWNAVRRVEGRSGAVHGLRTLAITTPDTAGQKVDAPEVATAA
jgi:hypothetical protein